MRLIDADELLAEYDRHHKGQAGGARKLIEDAPTIRTIQPRRGQWIMTNVGDAFMTDAPKIIYCSSCNVCAPYATNYCPMCGADMRGEQYG